MFLDAKACSLYAFLIYFFVCPYTEGFSLFDGEKQMVLVVKVLGENCSILMVILILIKMIPTMIVVRLVLLLIQLYFLGKKVTWIKLHVTLFFIGILK